MDKATARSLALQVTNLQVDVMQRDAEIARLTAERDDLQVKVESLSASAIQCGVRVRGIAAQLQGAIAERDAERAGRERAERERDEARLALATSEKSVECQIELVDYWKNKYEAADRNQVLRVR